MPKRKRDSVDTMFEDLFGFQAEGEPEPAPTPKRGRPKKKAEPKETIAPKAEPKEPPENWNPPTHMECGHMSWWLETQEDGTTVCGACQKRVLPNWRYTNRAIPKKFRRSKDIPTESFPGYCTNDDGKYIGGLRNDCRAETTDQTQWCEFHREILRVRGKS